MTPNPFDQAARYAAHQLDEPGFLAWMLPVVHAHYRWQGWLNTRNTPFPGEAERICDTVAAWVHPEGTEPPLATVLEFLSQPSAAYLEHLAAYTSEVRADYPYQASHPVVRYETIGVLVVLTGAQQADTWSSHPAHGGGAGTTFVALVRTLATQSAEQALARVESGELSRAVLPWVVLMQGGGEAGNITTWKRLAGAEPDARKRADYAGLLLVFAELAGRREVWERALEGWNVVESAIVKEWQAKARAEGLREGRNEGLREGAAKALRARLGRLAQARFQQPLPAEVEAQVAAADLEALERWFDLMLQVDSLDEFRAQANGA